MRRRFPFFFWQALFGAGLIILLGVSSSRVLAAPTATVPPLDAFKPVKIDCMLKFTKCESITPVLQTVTNFMIGLAGTLFFLMFLWGGFQYLAGAGNPDQTQKGHQTMIYAIIGLIVVLGAYAIIKFLLEAV